MTFREFSDGIKWRSLEAQDAGDVVVPLMILDETHLKWHPLSCNRNPGPSPGLAWVGSQIAWLQDIGEGNSFVPEILGQIGLWQG